MKKRKAVKSLIAILTIISIVALCFMGVGCSSEGGGETPSEESENKWISTMDTVPVDDGTKGAFLKVDVSRTTGRMSGDALVVDYYVRGTYHSEKWAAFDELRIDWKIVVGYKKQTSGSFNAGVTVGTEEVGFNIGGGTGVEYETVDRDNMYSSSKDEGDLIANCQVWSNQSNYIIHQAKYLDTHSLEATVTLKLKGRTTPYSVSAVK